MISVGMKIKQFGQICLKLEAKFGYDSLFGLVYFFTLSYIYFSTG